MTKVVFEYEGQVSGGLNSWDRDSQKRVTVELNDDDLTVTEMLEEFMNFMQAIGYKFEIGDRFDVVNDLKTEKKDDLKIDFSKYDAPQPIVDEGGGVIGMAEPVTKKQVDPYLLGAEIDRLRDIMIGCSEEALEMAAYHNLSTKGVI